MNKLGAYLAVFLALVFLPVATAVNPHSSQFQINNSTEDYSIVDFSIKPDNETSTSANIRLRYQDSVWQTYDANYTNNSFRSTINLTSGRGRYRYQWVLDNGTTSEYPEEPLRFVISSRNETLLNHSKSFTNNLSVNYDQYCSFNQSDFTCYYEHFQGQKISMNTWAYLGTQNKTYLERAKNYTFAEYSDEDSRGVCDQYDSDYDCENDGSGADDQLMGGAVPSAVRQGVLIDSLWTLYDVTSNSTVKSLARNYTKGVAENCPAWSNTTADFRGQIRDIENSSFTCDTAKGQGSMMTGYWQAYRSTGNTTYKLKAINYTQTNFSSPRVLRGLVSGYEVTNNNSYSVRMEEQAKNLLNKTKNLSTSRRFELGIGLMEAYRATGEYGYYRNALDLLYLNETNTSYTCSAVSSDFRCDFPDEQSLAGTMYWKGFDTQLDIPPHVEDPQFNSTPITGENATIRFSMEGKISNPKLHYKERGGGWENCTINYFDGCSLSGDQLNNQTVYSYFFNSSSLRFPENGSFRTALSIESDDLQEAANRFTNTDNERGSGQYCAIWGGDYSCEEEDHQAAMMMSMSKSFKRTRFQNYSLKLSELVSPPYYEDVTDLGTACAPGNDDFTCNSTNIQANLEGSVRQGGLINSLYSAYSSTDNLKALELAKKYASRSPEDCLVWEGDFNCNSSSGQAEMIIGYWTAYRVSGNNTFRDMALNLSHEGISKNGSQRLSSAYWLTYGYTKNETYYNKSLNITSGLNESCLSNDCGARDYYNTGQMYKDAYIYGNDEYVEDYRFLLTGTTTSTGCGPGKNDFSCSNPGDQGRMSELFTDASRYLPVVLKAEETFELGSSSVTVGNSVNAQCRVRNDLENTTLENVQFDINATEGLSVSGNMTKSGGDLNYTNSSSASWQISADSTGQHPVRCTISSTSGLTSVLERRIDVVSPDQGGGGGGGNNQDSSEGGQTPPPTGGDEENFSRTYHSSNISWNRSFITDLGVNTTLKEFSDPKSSCYRSVREVTENKSSLTVEFNCSSADGFVVVDRDQEGDVAHLEYFENTTKAILTHEMSSNMSQPLVLSYNSFAPLDIDVDFSFGLDRNNGFLITTISSNRPIECTVYRNDQEVFSNKTDSERVEISSENMNGVEVECADSEYSYRYEVEETSSDYMPVFSLPLMIFGLIFFRIKIFTAFRFTINRFYITSTTLIDLWHNVTFEWNLYWFRRSIDKEKPVKTIKYYKNLSSYADKGFTQRILNSNVDLMRGVKIYLLMDLVEEGIRDNVEMPVGYDIEQMVYRYMEEADDDRMKDMIQNKLEHISAIGS